MTSDEIFNFYDENWNDYNKVVDMLHEIVDAHQLEIRILNDKLNNKNDTNKVDRLKVLLQECQDKLDEETHRNL